MRTLRFLLKFFCKPKKKNLKNTVLFIWNYTLKLKCQFYCTENETNQTETNVGTQQRGMLLYYHKQIY